MMRYEPMQPLNSAGTATLRQLRTAVVATGLTLLMLDGTVKRPDDVRGIVRMTEESNPKVINRIQVGGVTTIVLPVTLLEVPTAELDQLKIESADDALRRGQANQAKVSRRETTKFDVLDTNGHELVERLKKIAGAKVLAEPTVVTVSGRPARFNIGGEFPLLVAMSDGMNVPGLRVRS